MLYNTLRQLEYIVAIADAGSLTDAARTLNVSQPALSVAISQVEQRQGRALFLRRKGAPILPSSFGQAFIHDARALLEDAHRLETPEIQSRRHLTRVTLGVYDDLAPTYLAPIMRHLHQHFPDVAITPQVDGFEALAHGMIEGHIHLSITYDLGLDASFEKRLLRHVVPHAFVAPDDRLANTSTTTFADLAHKPLILFNQGLSIRHMLAHFRTLGFHPRIAHRAPSLEVMRSLAANGEGVGISYTKPPNNISYDGKPLCAIPILDAAAREPIVLAYVDQNQTIAPLPDITRAILDMLDQSGQNTKIAGIDTATTSISNGNPMRQ